MLGAEVLLACLNHAHSNEAEEIMGLLLGDVLVGFASGAAGRLIAHVPQAWAAR